MSAQGLTCSGSLNEPPSLPSLLGPRRRAGHDTGLEAPWPCRALMSGRDPKSPEQPAGPWSEDCFPSLCVEGDTFW